MVDKFKITLEDVPYEVERRGELLIVNGQEFPFSCTNTAATIGGTAHPTELRNAVAMVDGISYKYEVCGFEEPKPGKTKRAPSAMAAEEVGSITAIMPGLIIKVMKGVGDPVEKDETVLILEAMKMQNEIKAKVSGKIKAINVKEGETVEMRQVLATIE